MKAGEATFLSLFEDGGHVVMPPIQRDYAQGRQEQLETRDEFVTRMHKALQPGEKSRPLNLDFVYGSLDKDGDRLEPLDGQQRLTTLFLLHAYLSLSAGRGCDFRERVIDSAERSRFTYHTRRSAIDFFDDFVRQGLAADAFVAEGEQVSHWLSLQPWFLGAWMRDPTVAGCLTMLDAIHQRFEGDCEGYSRLTHEEECPIHFRLLPLKNYGLSDDLYIKMNARGKALTGFEIFKARFGRYVERLFGDLSCPYDEDGRPWGLAVASRFDKEWTDLLWRKRDGKVQIDGRFQHLIRMIAFSSLAHDDPGDDRESLEAAIRVLMVKPRTTMAVLKEAGCLGEAFIDRLVRALDLLASCSGASLDLQGTDGYLDEDDLLRRVMVPGNRFDPAGLTHRHMIQFVAWLTFLLDSPDSPGSDQLRDSMHEWARVVRNLAINSGALEASAMARALAGLAAARSDAISGKLLERTRRGEVGAGFSQRQRREEAIKASLLLRDDAWREPIEEAELHICLDGFIGFLLEFAGVTSEVAANPRCTWSDERDTDLRASFVKWYERFCAVFGTETKEGPRRLGGRVASEWLWERAVLARGAYIWQKRGTRSLLSSAGSDAWVELLKDDRPMPDGRPRRALLGEVLGQISLDEVPGSLQQLIDEGAVGTGEGPPEAWRSALVAEPRLLDECQQGNIRFDEDTVFILNKERRSGTYHELFVLDLALRFKESDELRPLGKSKYREACGDPQRSRLEIRRRGFKLRIKGHFDELRFEVWGKNLDEGPLPEAGWVKGKKGRWVRNVARDAAESVLEELCSDVISASTNSD